MYIHADNLTKSFGKVVALRDVSVEVPPGEILAVVGENGAGKTTLLHSLAGIVAPDAGAIQYDSQLFDRDRIDLRRRFFVLPDFPQFFDEHTVLNHMGMVLKLYDCEETTANTDVLDLLRSFNLLPLIDARLRTLSRGQRYKAALAPLVAANPEVWMLDEPFASGLDPPGISEFRHRAQTAARRGHTIIYTTQIIELASTFSDRVCVLRNGRVEGLAAYSDLLEHAHTNDYLAEVLNVSATRE